MKHIKLVITDVDGVLTDGAICIDSEGHETKAFHVLDGTGIAYLHRAGYIDEFMNFAHEHCEKQEPQSRKGTVGG